MTRRLTCRPPTPSPPFSSTEAYAVGAQPSEADLTEIVGFFQEATALQIYHFQSIADSEPSFTPSSTVFTPPSTIASSSDGLEEGLLYQFIDSSVGHLSDVTSSVFQLEQNLDPVPQCFGYGVPSIYDIMGDGRERDRSPRNSLSWATSAHAEVASLAAHVWTSEPDYTYQQDLRHAYPTLLNDVAARNDSVFVPLQSQMASQAIDTDLASAVGWNMPDVYDSYDPYHANNEPVHTSQAFTQAWDVPGMQSSSLPSQRTHSQQGSFVQADQGQSFTWPSSDVSEATIAQGYPVTQYEVPQPIPSSAPEALSTIETNRRLDRDPSLLAALVPEKHSPPDSQSVQSSRKPSVSRLPGPVESSSSSESRQSPSGRRRSSSSRRGGRAPGTRLGSSSREHAATMRRAVACWRCALQRDPCDPGMPCKRCVSRAVRGPVALVACDRRHLTELARDFLPTSMTTMHNRQEVESLTISSVDRWYNGDGSPLKIRLTCGCGPSIDWMRLSEYHPKAPHLQYQMQYIANPNGQGWTCVQKRSPLLGLLLLDRDDEQHFRRYVDRILEESLDDFSNKCFEGEDPFQTELLRTVCDLYTDLDVEDSDLKSIVQELLRMMVVTFIMGHTLTIEEQYKSATISSLRQRGPIEEYARYTSPRLANMQLKYFFSAIRNELYESMLKRLHNIVRTAGDKSKTWLACLCILVCIAMVLEECQHTIHIQFDARVLRGGIDQSTADRDVRKECDHIDRGFDFLTNLFHWKYKKRNSNLARLGDYLPLLEEHSPEESFVHKLHKLIVRSHDFLTERRDVGMSARRKQLYTARLVARFTIPFMGRDQQRGAPQAALSI